MFTPGSYPFIDVANGGRVQGEIAALNHLLQLTVPATRRKAAPTSFPATAASPTKRTSSSSAT